MNWTNSLKKWAFTGVANVWAVTACTAFAGCLDNTPLRGVNLSGAEFGHTKLPGVMNKDYIYPSHDDLAYFRRQGSNIIRVPFRWERIQRAINGPLESDDIQQLQKIVNSAKSLNLCIVLDLHNFGTYQGHALGSQELPVAAFLDVWARLAQTFTDPTTTAFGLMNEPAAISVPIWHAIAQKAVLHLRSLGSRQLLLVSTGRWSGAHELYANFGGTSAATFFQNFEDPLDRFAIELHQYTDANYSGTTQSCIDPNKLKSILTKVTTWATQEKKQVFMGEFGTAATPECLAALNEMLIGMQSVTAWRGWTYWSAGPWWGDYAFSIQPRSGTEPAQFKLLKTYFTK